MRSERNCADAARAHKRVDTCGFHPLVNLPFSLKGLGADGRLRKQEKDAAVGLLLRDFRKPFAVLG